MVTRDDARVVHVFVEDQSAVRAEDVHDWLRIIGDIEETKTQYDTARQRSFYWIRFKHPSAAHVAVNHLDGERLKNHVVHISSAVYSKGTQLDGSSEKGPVRAVAEKKEVEEVENPSLPWNHKMPPDLRMDALLVDTIPALLSASASEGEEHDNLVQQLRQLQESYCHVQEEIQKAEEEIGKTDEEVMELLRGNDKPTTAPVEGKNDKKESTRDVEVTRRSRRIGNTVQIPMTFIDPPGLIVKFTRHIGPVTDYSFSVSADGKSFRSVVEFFHEDDAIYALQFLTGCSGGESHTKKDACVESEIKEALSPLSAFGWGEDVSAGVLHPHDSSIFSHAAHIRAVSLLQSYLR